MRKLICITFKKSCFALCSFFFFLEDVKDGIFEKLWLVNIFPPSLSLSLSQCFPSFSVPLPRSLACPLLLLPFSPSSVFSFYLPSFLPSFFNSFLLSFPSPPSALLIQSQKLVNNCHTSPHSPFLPSLSLSLLPSLTFSSFLSLHLFSSYHSPHSLSAFIIYFSIPSFPLPSLSLSSFSSSVTASLSSFHSLSNNTFPPLTPPLHYPLLPFSSLPPAPHKSSTHTRNPPSPPQPLPSSLSLSPFFSFERCNIFFFPLWVRVCYSFRRFILFLFSCAFCGRIYGLACVIENEVQVS